MGGKERGSPGGTAALLDLIEEHEAAIRWDFRRYLSLSLDDLGVTVTWREATHLLMELTRESGSHLVAALNGYKAAASFADLANILHAEAFVNFHRDRAEYPAPFRLPSPLADEPEASATDAELEEARALLERYSMIAQ